MEFIGKTILAISFNTFALILAAYFEGADFSIMTDPAHLIPLVALIAGINLLARPVLRIIFSPVISLTFGAFHIVISAALLYLVDILSNSITIQGLWPLIVGAHIMTLIVTLIDYSCAIIYGSGEL